MAHERHQIYTPDSVARALAGWLDADPGDEVRLLDPGAGYGVLAESALDNLSRRGVISVTAHLVEQDPAVARFLEADVRDWADWGVPTETIVWEADFVTWGLAARGRGETFSHVIMNPPYARIESGSTVQRTLAQQGIRVPNLYAAFLWLGIELLAAGGSLVAIVPRSFFNGRHFAGLRRRMLDIAHLERVHAFESRTSVFERDAVLQEVVMVKFRRIANETPVMVTRSAGADDIELAAGQLFDPSQLVLGGDCVIRVPAQSGALADGSWLPLFGGTTDLDVSTGSVVDFRTPQITTDATPGAVPLVDGSFELFNPGRKRAQRYLPSKEAERYVYPAGYYVVIKRISPKEQRPRIRIAVVKAGVEGIAFENHVNVVHRRGGALTEDHASRLAELMRSAEIQDQFDEISGSTQVNVSDLKLLRAPASTVADLRCRKL